MILARNQVRFPVFFRFHSRCWLGLAYIAFILVPIVALAAFAIWRHRHRKTPRPITHDKNYSLSAGTLPQVTCTRMSCLSKFLQGARAVELIQPKAAPIVNSPPPVASGEFARGVSVPDAIAR